ncbi:hypothetical protein CROQUDRAFT_669592 [Cronartium quercuum f. sp. fusiforme G11]|uniref:GST C-terminal domain-containing protein n=1 Tax=Cronartium quercuum f. sp. fusiforme G11 TaxID=708437 RepID=A0A9P6NKW0_9BASI|nr:hypothetical protein CROQUDRAFT_669592 [Cronartium quercuum f. sp. fusiforme G11]
MTGDDDMDRESIRTKIPNSQKDITKWASEDGHFRRVKSTFRDTISPNSRFSPEKGRYHLYISLACPWAHRTLILLYLKRLQSMIGLSIVHPHMGSEGWSWNAPIEFNPNMSGVIKDDLYSFKWLKEIYFKANPKFEGRFTVPVLFDKLHETIVNNESSEIVRILNFSFNDLLQDKYKAIDLYPIDLREEIDRLNEWVYDQVNNGVYKTGFATTQEAYEIALKPLFEGLDKLEKILEGGKKFLIGDRITEADVRLFTTIIRFDPVYVNHFKCNIKTIRDGYPNLDRWLRTLYWENSAFKERYESEGSVMTIDIRTYHSSSHPVMPQNLSELWHRVSSPRSQASEAVEGLCEVEAGDECISYTI